MLIHARAQVSGRGHADVPMVMFIPAGRLALDHIHIASALQLAECLAAHVVDFTTMFTFFTVEYERAATTLRESRVGNSKHPTLRHP